MPIYLTEYDQYLHSIGLCRKKIANDANSLFRAVSEVIYHTQHLHDLIRKECAWFIRDNRELILTQEGSEVEIDVEAYVENLAEATAAAGFIEVKALSFRYGKKILVFRNGITNVEPLEFDGRIQNEAGTSCEAKSGSEAKEADSRERSVIRLLHTPDNHFDLVFTLDRMEKMAIAQSLVYELVYTRLFNYDEAELKRITDLMLTEKHFVRLRKQRKLMQQLSPTSDYHSGGVGGAACQTPDKAQKSGPRQKNQGPGSQEGAKGSQTGSQETSPLLESLESPPFSYKVAKSLDPALYRNVAYDVWAEAVDVEQAKDVNIPHLGPGVKCRATFSVDGVVKSFICHVQDVDDDQQAVTAFVETMGQLKELPISSLEVLPMPKARKRAERRARLFGRRRERGNQSGGNGGDNDDANRRHSFSSTSPTSTPLRPLLNAKPFKPFTSSKALNYRHEVPKSFGSQLRAVSGRQQQSFANRPRRSPANRSFTACTPHFASPQAFCAPTPFYFAPDVPYGHWMPPQTPFSPNLAAAATSLPPPTPLYSLPPEVAFAGHLVPPQTPFSPNLTNPTPFRYSMPAEMPFCRWPTVAVPFSPPMAPQTPLNTAVQCGHSNFW